MTKEYHRKVQEKNHWNHPKIWCVLLFTCFVIGICAGAAVCAKTSEETNQSMYSYLNEFTQGAKDHFDKPAVLRNSIGNHSRIFLALFVSALFPAGVALAGGAVFLKGFTSGFTIAAFIKYYGAKGILLSAASLPVNLIFVPAMILFATVAVKMALERARKEKKMLLFFVLFSLLLFAIFCVCSFLEAYVTTTLMKFFAGKLV